jgi:DAK2 domain fusion protein YloV
LREMMRVVNETQASNAREVAKVMARGAMMGSRGNSGLLMSQLFKGMSFEFDGKQEVGAQDMASALQRGREYAYSVLGDPVEGTILTVFSSAAQAAAESAEAGGSLQELLEKTCSAARDAVARTPALLPKLRDAGVVDAGGLGLSVILDGLCLYVSGGNPEEYEVKLPESIAIEGSIGEVSLDFLDVSDEELYGYCTQFVIQGQSLDPDKVREQMKALALSTVVMGDEAAVKVHVHTEDPDHVLGFARSLGVVSHVSVQDMDHQRQEFAEARRKAAAASPQEGIQAPLAVIAVAWGEGLEKVFREQGARVLVAGDTMNPSVGEIVEAIESAPSRNVIFLPNNRNIVGTAQQARELTSKSLRVVPTTSIPQGIAAVLEFIEERSADENAAAMESAFSEVRTGEICYAIRSVEMNGISAEEGQVIGLLERVLVASGYDPVEVLLALLREANAGAAELITLYRGGPMTEADASAALEEARAAFPGVEFELIAGGQPHYHFIVSIE